MCLCLPNNVWDIGFYTLQTDYCIVASTSLTQSAQRHGRMPGNCVSLRESSCTAKPQLCLVSHIAEYHKRNSNNERLRFTNLKMAKVVPSSEEKPRGHFSASSQL